MNRDSATAVLVAATLIAVVTPVFAQNAPGQAPGTPAPSNPAPQAPTAPATPNNPNGSNLPSVGSTQNNPAKGTTTPQNPTATGSGSQVTGNDSPDFDIDRAMRGALASSTGLANVQRLLRADAAQVGIAAAEGRTNVSASGTATEFDQPTKISFAGSPPIYALHNNREVATIGLSQKIDLTGQIRAATGQAKLQTLADRFTADRIAQSRVLEAKTDYYNYLRASHQVQVAESELSSVQSQRDIAKRLFEGGIGQKIDYLRAETNVANAQQDLTRARNNADVARATFNDLVGRPLNSAVNAKDVEGVTVGTDVKASGAVGTAVASFTPYLPPTEEVDAIRSDESITTAQSRRPEILQNAVLVRVAETGIKLARAGLEPGLTLSGGGNYYPTTSFADVRRRTAEISASLTIPLYDGGATRDRVTVARTRVDTAKANLESSKTDVALAVREAYLNLATAARQITAANAALQEAIAARELAQVRYEGQVGLFLEVTDAQAALTRAENTQVDAVYDYLIARARFENATGTPVQY